MSVKIKSEMYNQNLLSPDHLKNSMIFILNFNYLYMIIQFRFNFSDLYKICFIIWYVIYGYG